MTEDDVAMAGNISYRIDARDGTLNCFSVEMKFDSGSGDAELCMPVWTPGSYAVVDFAGQVMDLKAYGPGNREKKVHKKDKSTWVVRGDGGSITVRYRVHAHSVNVHACFIDTDRLTINGAGAYLYVRGMEHLPAEVEILPPPGWDKVSTGLAQTGKWSFRAENYDVLIDSPIEAGTHEVHRFEVAGKEHELALYGKGNIDTGKFLADLKRIVASEISIMKDVPYRRYVFIYQMIPKGGGGLEHLNSTHCITDPFDFTERSDYLSVLELFSHEFFHLWNVKRLRPRALGPFDYSRENYTKLLWVSEGFTSYFELTAIRKGKVSTPAEFLRALAREMETFMNTPGRNYQSAEESSFDTWIKFYRRNENTVNSVVSYYNKGCLIGMLLDLFIISATGGKRRLDDVMRLLYRTTYKKGVGFTEEDFRNACKTVSGKDIRAFYSKCVAGRGDLPFEKYLGLAGLKLETERNGEKGSLHILMSRENKSVVASVLEGGPAADAGIYPKDEIIAINGMRTKGEDLKARIGELVPGETAQVLVAREGLLKGVKVKVGRRPAKLTVKQNEKATAGQKSAYEHWSYAKWKDGIDYEGVKDPLRYTEYMQIL